MTAKTVRKPTPKCSSENIFGYITYPSDCPCCKGRKTVDLLTRDQFGGEWGYTSMAYRCRECHAMVGANNAGEAMGVLGDSETRRMRKETHKYFDVLWKKANSKYRSRSAAYRALSKAIDVEYEDCHIANMDSYTLSVVLKMLRNDQI